MRLKLVIRETKPLETEEEILKRIVLKEYYDLL
jgi:hypothetical protein